MHTHHTPCDVYTQPSKPQKKKCATRTELQPSPTTSYQPLITRMSKVVKFEGHNYFRQRLVLATLSGKILKIEKIRSNDANPGLRGKPPKPHSTAIWKTLLGSNLGRCAEEEGDSLRSNPLPPPTYHRFRGKLLEIVGEGHQRRNNRDQLYRYISLRRIA